MLVIEKRAQVKQLHKTCPSWSPLGAVGQIKHKKPPIKHMSSYTRGTYEFGTLVPPYKEHRPKRVKLHDFPGHYHRAGSHGVAAKIKKDALIGYISTKNHTPN